MSCREWATWLGTRIVTPAVAARWHATLFFRERPSRQHCDHEPITVCQITATWQPFRIHDNSLLSPQIWHSVSDDIINYSVMKENIHFNFHFNFTRVCSWFLEWHWNVFAVPSANSWYRVCHYRYTRCRIAVVHFWVTGDRRMHCSKTRYLSWL